MANNLAVPVPNEPGALFIPALGRKIKMVEWREDDFYDSVLQASGAISAGTSLEFFRDLSNKNLQHTNLRTARRIPAGSEFIMARLGVLIAQAVGETLATDDDTLVVAYAGSLTFKLNDRLISEGMLVKYQTGIGVTGSTTRTGTGVVTLGVPSAAAAPSLMVAQPVSDTDDLMGTVDFKSATWISGYSTPTLTNAVLFTIMLHGFIKKPQGK
jgi:hypothetical protein